jgi:t-SNARE complex subunit (syntaxin)
LTRAKAFATQAEEAKRQAEAAFAEVEERRSRFWQLTNTVPDLEQALDRLHYIGEQQTKTEEQLAELLYNAAVDQYTGHQFADAYRKATMEASVEKLRQKLTGQVKARIESELAAARTELDQLKVYFSTKEELSNV